MELFITWTNNGELFCKIQHPAPEVVGVIFGVESFESITTELEEELMAVLNKHFVSENKEVK